MPFSNPEFDRYRLVLVSPLSRRVLVEKPKNELRLPRISVPRWTRVAAEITALIRERWHFRGIVLDSLGDGPGGDNVIIAQRIDEGSPGASRGEQTWVALGNIADSEIDDRERSVLQRLLADGKTGRGPFSRLGWIDEALNWCSAETGLHRSQISVGMRQLNASAHSSLIRVSGEGGRTFWFKAAGESKSYEKRVTATLSKLFPAYLPRILAFHEAWNAWLMEDAGIPLGGLEPVSPKMVEQVIRRLAELQVGSIRHVETLLADGCRDHRMEALRAGITELVPYLEEAVEIQDVDSGPSIGVRQIRRIARLVEEASFKLEAIGIPDGLTHCDIDLQNVLIGGSAAVFTDWAHAGVGNPFATFEQLRAQLAQEMDLGAQLSHLTAVYLDAWEPALSGHQVEYAITLLPLIAAASYLVYRREWLTSERHHVAQSRSYARILIRRMHRAAQTIESDKRICA